MEDDIQNYLPIVMFSGTICIYMVTHKGWDSKDDFKLIKYENSKVELNAFALNIDIFMAFSIVRQRKKNSF